MNITSPILKALVDLLDAGKQPVVQVISHDLGESSDYEKGMMFRCLSYSDDSVGEEPDDTVIIVLIEQLDENRAATLQPLDPLF